MNGRPRCPAIGERESILKENGIFANSEDIRPASAEASQGERQEHTEPISSESEGDESGYDEYDEDEDDDDDEESDFDSEAAYEEFEGRDKTLPALPARLKLPIELEMRVLESERLWSELWLHMRPVCKAWCEHIESLAQRKWLRRAYLHFPYKKYMTRGIGPSEWEFQRLEDDGTMVLQDTEPAPSKELAIAHCKLVFRPDIVLGHSVFKIDIPGLAMDYDALTARVPWRNYVARVFAEEHAINVEQDKGMRAQLKVAARLRHEAERGRLDEMEVLRRAISGFGAHLHDVHQTVHKRHAANAADGPQELQRLKDLRFAVGWGPIDSDEDAEEEQRAADGELSARDAAVLLRDVWAHE